MKIKHINRPIKDKPTTPSEKNDSIEYSCSVKKQTDNVIQFLKGVVEALKGKSLTLYRLESRFHSHLTHQHQENLHTLLAHLGLEGMSESDLDSLFMVLAETLLPITALLEIGLVEVGERDDVYELTNLELTNNQLTVTLINRPMTKDELAEIQYLADMDEAVEDAVSGKLEGLADKILKAVGLTLTDKAKEHFFTQTSLRPIYDVVRDFLLQQEYKASK